MSDLSRREVFKLAGIALAANAVLTHLNFLHPWVSTPVGRVLHTAAVLDRPYGNSIELLFPDTVVTLVEKDADWYRLPQGWVTSDSIQPMLPGQPLGLPSNYPAPVQVAAAAASLHSYADLRAPLISRVGHGGIVYALDYLAPSARTGAWLGVGQDSATLIGWTPADRWRSVESRIGDNRSPIESVHIERRHRKIVLVAQGAPLAEFKYAGGRALSPGQTRLLHRQLCASVTDGGETRMGVPWLLTLENGLQIYAVYWHNVFSDDSVTSNTVHLPLMAAKWIFEHVSTDTVFEIV